MWMADPWRRTLGRDKRGQDSADAAVALLVQNPNGLEAVIAGMGHADHRVRRRCVIAVERVSLVHPEWVEPYAVQVIECARDDACYDLRRHFVAILLRLSVGVGVMERHAIVRLLFNFANDGYGSMRKTAVEALFNISRHDPVERCRVIELVLRLYGRFGAADRGRLERIFKAARAEARESIDRSTHGAAILFTRRR
jgi:hypothetical protein